MGYWGALIYSLNSELTVLIFNELFSAASEGEGRKNWREYSTFELFLVNMPFNIFGAGVATILLVLLLPERSFSVHCLIPVTYQSSLTYFACSVLDVAFLVNETSVGSVGMFILLAFFLKIDRTLDTLKQVILSNDSLTENSLDEALVSCRKIQLQLCLFNQKFMNMNYLMKLFDMIAIVSCYYVAIVYHDQNPRFAFSSLLLGLNMMTGFLLLFDKAFEIPMKMQDVKGEISLASHILKKPGSRKYVRCRVTSLQSVGVKMGGFSTLERQSTPNFLHFIVSTVTDLIVATQ
ncbi:unnamed protein product [Allacma fusca]|uniref:Uncharacterized protein n=1 Tax=Allacma fusca TaxID=39272 RepID=A0A8J2KSB6_9HEXA|nr:unnamed protein product [Allacma fusca]